MVHTPNETQCQKWVLYSAKSNCGRVDRDGMFFIKGTDINFQ